MYGGPTTVNFSATQVSTWDFGDGSTGSGISVSHTYGAPGTYIVCASSTNADGSICKQCDTICLSNTSDSLVEGGGGGITKGGHGGWGFVCDADFAVVVTGNSIVGWPGPDPFFVSPSGVFVWTWGDGTVTSGVGGTPEPHTYPGPGTYTICLQRTMYNSEGDTLVCSKCFTICIASGGNGGNDARHMSPSGVTPVTIYSDGIQLAPNPATDMTTLTLSLEQPSGVKVIMSDEVGHIISYVVNEQLVAGMHQFDIPTGKLLPGIYYIKIETAAGITVKRLSVLK
jgi:PKD repeat protein